MALNERSKKALVGVHPDLVKVTELAHDLARQNGLDFIITEGCRTLATQRRYVAKGVSQTLKSRHIPARIDCDRRELQCGRPRSVHPRPCAGVELRNATHTSGTSETSHAI